MWDKEFELKIMKSLVPLNVHNINNKCFKGTCNEDVFFVKKIIPQKYESLYEAKVRIEESEKLAKYYKDYGFNTITPVIQNGECTHQNPSGVWCAYPWVDAASITEPFTENNCHLIGAMLGEMHSLSFKSSNTYNASKIHKRANFDWIQLAKRYSVPELCVFLEWEDSLKKILEYSYNCANKLLTSPHKVIAHGDLHSGNVMLKDGKLLVIDWEWASLSNPEIDLIDTALNWCGFCQNNTNLTLFELVVKEYYKAFPANSRQVLVDYAIGSIYYGIIEFMSNYIFDFIKTRESSSLNRAIGYLNEFKQLKANELFFTEILLSHSSK